MIGKICMVTGASGGVGKDTSLQLAERGATVVMVCRNLESGKKVLGEVKRKTNNDSIFLLQADLSSQTAIRQLATDFRNEFPFLHVLINNAAIISRKHTITSDSPETQFAVNHLAYFLLTNLLLDVLEASAPARVVNVGSEVHRDITIDFYDLESERVYCHRLVYARTKLANLLFTYELAERLRENNVTVNRLHPGVISTNLLAAYEGMPRFFRFLTMLKGAKLRGEG
jgi:NAD(P)-dependent dehydrogenase (short-subunit alcohol dehydrogenase family)